MAYNKNENKINEEQVAAFLAETLKRVNSDNDPESLDQLKKIFKKNIPFSRRMYVAAYLVRQASGRFSRPNKFNDRFNRTDRFNRSERPVRTERTEHSEHFAKAEGGERAERTERAPRVQIDPSLATTIFISIGRNRRVFPRDLVGLLVSVAGLDRDRIGDIRVLANYSFIQLFTEDCEKVIKALNDYDYRGRKLSVSYSKQKDEEEENESPCAEETIPSNVSNESSGVHAEESQEAKIAEEQSVYAAQQSTSAPSTEAPYSETTDDGQVKSHFGNGDTNYLV